MLRENSLLELRDMATEKGIDLYIEPEEGKQRRPKTKLELAQEMAGPNKLSATFQPHAKKMLAGVVTTHAGLAILNSIMGGEDDDDGELWWSKIPGWEKRNNMIIMDWFGQSGGGIKVPTPYGYNVPGALGTILGEVLMGIRPKEEIAPFIWETSMNAFSPFGGGQELLDMITPTLAKPMVELSRNRDWKGAALYKDRYGDRTLPD